MQKLKGFFILAFIAMFFFINQEAHAYVNPGSGSYLFQVIIGGFLSIIYFFKKIIIKIFSIFKKNGKKEE